MAVEMEREREREMRKFVYGERNERGERLLEFATLNNLYICSTKFKRKPSRKWTWESPNGRDKNMIDMILIEQEAQLMLTTGSTRLAVSRGQQTWYHSTCYIWFPIVQ